jgi:tetratricopeptide (TPR) repeat protein
MAPEQVEGRLEEIGPATDVYGLGVLLYECLTGRRPFIGHSDAETMQRILTEEPTPPGRLRPGIGRDIEAICLKCLEKRPGQRYATARALQDDLRRYLAGEPIWARRVTKLERLARWARRNPGIAALSAAVLLLLTALALGSTVAAVAMARLALRERTAAEAARSAELLAQEQADRAENFADRARSESETSKRVANFLEGMFRSADPVGLEGFRFRAQVDRTTELTAAEVLRQGAERLRVDLAGQPEVQARLMAALGSVYVTLGMLREAQPLLEESLRIREELCGEDSLETAESLHNLATLRFANFDFSETKRLLKRALAIRSELLAPTHPDTIRTKFNLAWMVVTNGHETRAEKLRALPLMEEVLQFHRQRSDSPTQFAFALLGLAMLRYDVDNKPFEAAALVAEANRVLHKNGDSDIAAGLTFMLRSYLQRRLGNSDAAVKSVEAAIDRMRKAVGERHPMLVWPRYLLAEALIGCGDYAKALDVYRETTRFCGQIYDDRHRTIGITKARMAEPLLLMNDLAQAETTLREALDIFRQEGANLPNRVHCMQELVAVLDLLDRNADAAELCRRELISAASYQDNFEARAYRIAILRLAAQVDEARGMFAPARAAIEEAVQLQEALCGAHDPLVEDLLWQQARLDLAAGDVDEYRTACRRLVAAFDDETEPDRLLNLVWICELVPGAVEDPHQLVPWAEKALSRNRLASAHHTVLAGALYRAGEYDRAIEQLQESIRLHQTGGSFAAKVFLSMAHARRGEMDEARDWFEKALHVPVPEATTAAAKIQARRTAVEREVLAREARELLEQSAGPQ